MLRSVITALAALALTAHAASAQSRDKERDIVPPGQRPPPGLCRIWLRDVPASQQPAPTDCATAVRNRPDGARIIFPEERSGERVRLPIPALTRSAEPERDALRRLEPESKKDKKDKKDKRGKPEKP